MRNTIIALCLLLVPALGLAQDAHKTARLGTLLNAAALNGSSLTFYVGLRADCGASSVNSCDPTSTTDNSTGDYVQAYSKLRLRMDYSHANNGAITLTCTEGMTRAGADGTPSTATLASGTYTLAWSGVVTTPSLTGNTVWPIVLNTNGAPVIKCVVSHGGTPNASDTITVTGWLIAD
jgi:hypothetical protein